MAIDAKEMKRLKNLLDAGWATAADIAQYQIGVQEQNGAAAAGGAGDVMAAGGAGGPVTGEQTLEVDPEAFRRGWSSGGSTPPDHDGIFRGVSEGFEMARSGEDTAFFWFRSAGFEPGQTGYWRGSYVADKLTAPDGRAGKVKDILSALDVTPRIQGTRVTFPDLRGREADCDWQTVEIKLKRERRIQGVYPVGEHTTSV